MTYELPPGWARAPLGSLGDWLGGGTPSKSVASYWRNGTVHWVSPKDMKRPLIDSAQDQITEKAVRESATNLVPANSVLMVTRSGILEHSFPVAVNTIPVTMNQDLKAVAVRGVDSIYTRYFLQFRSQDILRTCKKDGTTVSSIDTDRLAAYSVSIAPEPEQKRIVSKIDELFSCIDEGERALERVQTLVERYRQSVLKAAVTGELTREWREKNKDKLESGEALLARILKARREAWEKAELEKMKSKGIIPANDKWKQNYEAPISPETAELPELPDDWVWASLDQFAAPVERAIQSGPFGSNLLHSEFQSEGKLVIGIDNVRDGWYSRGSQNRISGEKFQQLQKYKARPKDFLITVMATIGRTCVLPDDIEPAIITKHVYRFTLDRSLVLPEFVNLCVMGSPAVRTQIFGNVRGQTRPGLNKSLLTQFGFPLPPIEEQRLILDRSAELLSRLAPCKENVDAQQLRSRGLRQAVLKSAFNGNLVAQSANDEPASFLLERIAAERGTDNVALSRSRK